MLHLQLNLANTVSARIMNRIYCIILHRRCFCLVARPSRMHRMQFFGSAAQMVSLHFAERRRINTFVGIVWIWPDMILVSSRKAPVHLAIDLTPRDIQFSLGCDVSDNWKTVAWDATGKEDFSICDSIVHNNTIYTFGILRIDMDWHGLAWIDKRPQKRLRYLPKRRWPRWPRFQRCHGVPFDISDIFGEWKEWKADNKWQ